MLAKYGKVSKVDSEFAEKELQLFPKCPSLLNISDILALIPVPFKASNMLSSCTSSKLC